MSSSDGPASKKRRLQRACDNCKKRKTKCDGAEMPGSNCTNCLTAGIQCTHIEVTKNLGSAQGYVQGLEHRVKTLTLLFQRLLPDVDLDQELADDGTPHLQDTARLVRNDKTHAWVTLNLAAERLTLEDPVEQVYGKSSNVYLERLIRDEKAIHFGQDSARLQEPSSLRQDTWWPRPWHQPRVKFPTPEYTFPDPELLTSLVDVYFLRENSFLPLLHRPTFERSLAGSRHIYDDMFGGVVLLVCALASRYTNDPRVYAFKVDDPGWPFFEQVTLLPPLPGTPASLVELQVHCLYVIYLQHLGQAETMWIRLGTAIRMAQEAGAHVNRSCSSTRNARDELWKRVFWVLIFLDVSFSAIIGRPSAIHCEDFDVQYPIDCDDEYWDHPDPRLNFRQPTNKPSSLTFFIQLIKLVEILSDVQRAVYPMKRECKNQPQVLTELDAALNKWLRTMPSHLLWDPHRQHTLFFRQSAFLHMKFYFVQILTHRPYIPAPSVTLLAQTSLFPSLSICTNAASSCLRIVEAQKERGYLEVVQVMVSAYTAALVLLLSAWRDLPPNAPVSVKPEMKGVYVCLEMLKACERPWSQFPFVLGDTLSKLISGDLAPYPAEASSMDVLRQQNYDRPGPSELGVNPALSYSQLYSDLLHGGRDFVMGYPEDVDDQAYSHPASLYNYSQPEYMNPPFNAPSGQ